MLDAVVIVLCCNVNWWIVFDYVAIAGFPFTFAILYMMWTWKLLPEPMYTEYDVSCIHVLLLLLAIDVMQTACHCAAHTVLRHTIIGRSHAIHHRNRHPKPQDAFYTGFVDAGVQLLLPLYVALQLVQPSRSSAILFGSVYSWWLLFIHSESKKEFPWLEYFRLVTPRYHHKHHLHPRTNFSNLFTFF